MYELAACATKNGARRFRLTTDVIRFGDASAAGTDGEPPALFTTMSSRPKRLLASATTAAAWPGSRTSAATNCRPADSGPGPDQPPRDGQANSARATGDKRGLVIKTGVRPVRRGRNWRRLPVIRWHVRPRCRRVLALYPAAGCPYRGNVLGSGQHGNVGQRIGADRNHVGVVAGLKPAALRRLPAEGPGCRCRGGLHRLQRRHPELDQVHELGAVRAPGVGPVGPGDGDIGSHGNRDAALDGERDRVRMRVSKSGKLHGRILGNGAEVGEDVFDDGAGRDQDRAGLTHRVASLAVEVGAM